MLKEKDGIFGYKRPFRTAERPMADEQTPAGHSFQTATISACAVCCAAGKAHRRSHIIRIEKNTMYSEDADEKNAGEWAAGTTTITCWRNLAQRHREAPLYDSGSQKAQTLDCRAEWDVAFDSEHRPLLLNLKLLFQKRSRGVQSQPNIDMAGQMDEECRNRFCEMVSSIAKKTPPVLMPRKRFAFAPAETRSTCHVACVARITGDLSQEKRLRRKLDSQLKCDRENEWTTRAK
ncbi:hypothetical protein RB195_021841 [Necator americanus]|uniref:Endonuclease/exonuclease/phosphatase domain-containing protein n=1 Tax=Necator americanus TaxID=51031 RepID=A0ABR1EFI3_NECAM